MNAYVRRHLWSEREVASDIDISTAWVELSPAPLLKATKRVQQLIILVSGCERGRHDFQRQLPLPDGTAADPEVVLVDEGGESFRLRPSRPAPSGVGYVLGRASEPGQARGKRYPKVRLRSDKPFRASKVIWENSNPK